MRKVRSQRFTRCLLVAVAAALVTTPALAHPPTPVDERGRAVAGKLHAWMHQAKVPLVRGRVQIRRQACTGHPSFVGCVFTRRPRTLYLSPRVHKPRAVLYTSLVTYSTYVYSISAIARGSSG